MSVTTVSRDKGQNLQILNPKRHADPEIAKAGRLFSYYAGYSEDFTEQLIRSFKLPLDAVVFDPWNGSGTTTHIAGSLGHHAIGMDLNPVMVVVAKAISFPRSERSSLAPLAKSIISKATISENFIEASDPLLIWLSPQAANLIRSIEKQLNCLLISADGYRRLVDETAVNQISGLAAFFYVALFRTVRGFLNDFIPSNPTWTKKPASIRNRKNPSGKSIVEAFSKEVQIAINKISIEKQEDFTIDIRLGNAEEMHLSSQSVDLVVTSPPYCTRIDYAMATAIELAVLGVREKEFISLRRTLTGTSMVNASVKEAEEEWGPTCVQFLQSLQKHESKASSTYYLKNHIQYFRSLYRSIAEISRVLKSDGSCVLVAQTSHYKDLLNDVPEVIYEMAKQHGLDLIRREDFTSSRTMASLNMRAKRHLATRKTFESVLCFRRTVLRNKILVEIAQ